VLGVKQGKSHLEIRFFHSNLFLRYS